MFTNSVTSEPPSRFEPWPPSCILVGNANRSATTMMGWLKMQDWKIWEWKYRHRPAYYVHFRCFHSRIFYPGFSIPCRSTFHSCIFSAPMTMCELCSGAHGMRVSMSRTAVPLRLWETPLQRRNLPVPVPQPWPGTQLLVSAHLERGGVHVRLSANSKLPPRWILQLCYVHVSLRPRGSCKIKHLH